MSRVQSSLDNPYIVFIATVTACVSVMWGPPAAFLWLLFCAVLVRLMMFAHWYAWARSNNTPSKS